MAQDTATQNSDEARDFRHTARAVRFVKQHRLTNVQIVLKFPKTTDDVNLAILELLEREQKKANYKMQPRVHFSSSASESDKSR
ncbi:MAG: hypothetical protein ABIQ35_14910 [Verrucomicrobiota bacterium]